MCRLGLYRVVISSPEWTVCVQLSIIGFPRSTTDADFVIGTPEDVILQKLIWYRPKDHEDVLGVIAVNHDKLDKDCLRQWADQFGLTEAFESSWAMAIESRE